MTRACELRPWLEVHTLTATAGPLYMSASVTPSAAGFLVIVGRGGNLDALEELAAREGHTARVESQVQRIGPFVRLEDAKSEAERRCRAWLAHELGKANAR